MKFKYRTLTPLWFMAMTHAAFADTATDTQTLTLQVPLVALIDVQDISPSFTFNAPTEAGEGFSGGLTATDNTPTIDISSNDSGMKLKVSVSNNDLQTVGVSLQVMAMNPVCPSFGSATLTTTPQTLCTVGTRRVSGETIIINAIPSGGVSSMIPYGTYDTTSIVYTLSSS